MKFSCTVLLIGVILCTSIFRAKQKARRGPGAGSSGCGLQEARVSESDTACLCCGAVPGGRPGLRRCFPDHRVLWWEDFLPGLEEGT